MRFNREFFRRQSFRFQTFVCFLGAVFLFKVINLARRVAGKKPWAGRMGFWGGTGGGAVATLAVRREGKPSEMRPGSHE
jgi:hypothetical protein